MRLIITNYYLCCLFTKNQNLIMGKGDKKTRRGKITIGSYGKTRPHKEAAPVVAESEKKKKSTKKTTSSKKS